MKKYKVIGIMSGTSCDGLDIAYCEFSKQKSWSYKIIKCQTIKYNQNFINKISREFSEINKDLIELDYFFGKFIGLEINKFIKKHELKIDLVCSHGHTVIHNPEKKISFQIGCGKTIRNITKTTTINDFRIKDIEMGGQGAPLVPIGDNLLFKKYKYCLNLGGFANISEKTKNNIIGYDICPCNIILNYYSKKMGFPFDNKGALSSKGNINEMLLNELNNLNYYRIEGPKSLDVSWVRDNFIPTVDKYKLTAQNILATISKHIAQKIGEKINKAETIVSGGGCFNNHVINMIKKESNSKIVIPDIKTINYKEAMIFGFIGILKFRNEINCYNSVTGARENSIVGVINKYL